MQTPLHPKALYVTHVYELAKDNKVPQKFRDLGVRLV